MNQHNLSNDELRALMDEEARASEAAALDEDDGAPLPPHVKVSRPNRRRLAPAARGKVLQVRLSEPELEALEAFAARRGLAVSTVARAQLLELVRADMLEVSDPAVEFEAAAEKIQVLVAQMRELVVTATPSAGKSSGLVPDVEPAVSNCP